MGLRIPFHSSMASAYCRSVAAQNVKSSQSSRNVLARCFVVMAEARWYPRTAAVLIVIGRPLGAHASLLRQRRIEAGLTQAALAELAGLSTRTIQHLEAGLGQPFPESTRRLADALGLTAEVRAEFVAAARPARWSGRASPDARQAASTHPNPPNNLPIELTTFIGRERELVALRGLLSETRLLTLTGTGGVGKTRLAQTLASEAAQHYAGGVYFVELAGLADPDLVIHSMATAIGITERPRDALRATLVDALRQRQVLLVLDNCEHLVSVCADVVHLLLRTSTELRVLTTSREPLGVAGETIWTVPPLSLPNCSVPFQEMADSDAVRLFNERARVARPDLVLTEQDSIAVAEICRALDGIPLAVELAAAWVRMLSPQEVVGRLRQGLSLLSSESRTIPERHRTLRAAVDWSYTLLGDRERQLFQRLSVFAGGWTLEAAESVCADNTIPEEDVLALLTSLTDKSLVIVQLTQGRFRLLEPLRQYAVERLSGASADAVRGRDQHEIVGERVMATTALEGTRSRHAIYFLGLAEKAEQWLEGPAQADWLDRLERDHDNLRAALRWFVTSGDVDKGLSLAAALWRFWWLRGHVGEGRARLSELVVMGEQTASHEMLSKALNAAGTLARHQGDYAAAEGYIARALELRRQLGDKRAIASCLHNAGAVAVHRGHWGSARTQLMEALLIGRAVEDRAGVADALGQLGLVALLRGDYDAARPLVEEALAIWQRADDAHATAWALTTLGCIEAHTNVDDAATARSWLEKGLLLGRTLAVPWLVAYAVEGFARLASVHANWPRAVRLASAAERLREDIGHPLSPAAATEQNRRLNTARMALGEVAWDAARDAGRTLATEQAIEAALSQDESGRSKGETAPTVGQIPTRHFRTRRGA